MERVYLVRHGESENHVSDVTGGWTDLPLTQKGLNQAVRTGYALQTRIGDAATVILSSDLTRARMTAEMIARCLAVKVHLDPGLRELSNGSAAGLSTRAARAIELPRSMPEEDWVPYPGAESRRQLEVRIAECMQRLMLGSTGSAIIVSHADAGDALVKWWLSFPEPARHLVRFTLDTCSITELARSHGGLSTLVSLNDTGHLASRAE